MKFSEYITEMNISDYLTNPSGLLYLRILLDIKYGIIHDGQMVAEQIDFTIGMLELKMKHCKKMGVNSALSQVFINDLKSFFESEDPVDITKKFKRLKKRSNEVFEVLKAKNPPAHHLHII